MPRSSDVLVASSVRAVMAQRLLRRVCKNCGYYKGEEIVHHEAKEAK